MMPALENRNGLKILVVDDDPNEMRSLVIGLKLEGFDAIGAASGTVALEMMSKKKYSVVIIDLMMPEMNGLQLARAVRASFPAATTLLMSAYHLSPIQLARADTGVAGFVPKPFCFDELVRFINAKTDSDNGAAASPSKETELNIPIDVSSPIRDRDSQLPIVDPGELISSK